MLSEPLSLTPQTERLTVAHRVALHDDQLLASVRLHTSAEILHQHQVPAGLIRLRPDQSPSVGRD
jgi:hypothetical protein